MSVQNTPNYPAQPAMKRPTYAPSYNAVQINLDTPTLNAPQAPGYYYDYPQAPAPAYYPPVQAPVTVPQQPVNAAPVAPVNVPQPQVPAQAPVAPTAPAAAPETQAPAAPVQTAPAAPAQPDDISKVLANLSDPDFDKQAAQMEEIAKKGLTNEADAVPYVQEEIFNKLFDIINTDSSKLAGPTEQQLQLREKVAQNDLAIFNAQQAGKDPKTVQLPNTLTAEEEKLANTITPLEQAERNKEYALFTTAVLQKTYGDEIEKRNGTVVPLTDLPGAAVVVDELKSNQNPAIRMAAIDALRYVQRPEYKNDLAQVYTIAQGDADEGVSAAATDALNSLNTPKA